MDLLASASEVLGLKLCSLMPCLQVFVVVAAAFSMNEFCFYNYWKHHYFIASDSFHYFIANIGN